MAEEQVAAEGVVTEGAPSDAEATDAEPFAAPEGELTGGEAGAAEGVETPDLFTVKVGGREEQVTLDDLTNGYMRQADYTRKTQELSSQRDQVQQMLALQTALERDPRTTLVALAGALGVELGQAQTAAIPALGADADPLEILAREVESLRGTLTAQQQADLAARQQAQQQAQLRSQIDQEIADLKGSNGEFDHMELVRYAVEHQTPSLSVAYRAWQFDKAEAAKLAERNRAVAAKRGAQVVSGGRASTAAGATAPSGSDRPTFREALSMALAQHGSS